MKQKGMATSLPCDPVEKDRGRPRYVAEQ